MKRTLLFVLALIAVGCAEPIPRNLDDLSRQGLQYLDPETLEPYRGPAYRMSEDDSTQIVLRVNLRDGRFHGDFEDFDPERVGEGVGLYETGTYRDGQREGRYEYFYPSGVLRGRGTYENGLPEGPYESYYENGEPRNKINYTDGELDGPWETYLEKGQLFVRGTYENGDPNGRYEGEYSENGQVRLSFTYNMNRPPESNGQATNSLRFGDRFTHPETGVEYVFNGTGMVPVDSREGRVVLSLNGSSEALSAALLP